MSALSHLPLAVRAHTVPVKKQDEEPKKLKRRPGIGPTPKLTLVFDCETRMDLGQSLTFGSYRVYDETGVVDEAIFYADDLPAAEREILRNYCRTHHQSDSTGAEPLRLLTRTRFLNEVFYPVAFVGRGAVVGFNLPFDLSRLALGWSKARTRLAKGGFSFYLLDFVDKKTGRRRASGFHPRLAVKTIDGKRARMVFTSIWGKNDRIRTKRKSKKGGRSFLVDCRTLAFALTNEAYTLAKACEVFGVEHGKEVAKEHGRITPEYIDYNRRDVLATWELYQKLLAEFERHPIPLAPNRAYSPATIGKAYLRAMHIKPPRVQAAKSLRVSADTINGYAMAAYFGGRAECHIRKIPVPVVYCDFLSMYPTVNILMGLWDYLTAGHILAEDATAEVTALLYRVTADDLFRPSTWKELTVLVQIEPADDLLPARANYGDPARPHYSIGSNFVTSAKPLWYTLADCIASKLRTGKSPRVLRAIHFRPVGKRRGLLGTSLRGCIPFDPQTGDFFKKVVEARQAAKTDQTLSSEERKWLEHSLKTLANSTSYGIFIELNRDEEEKTEIVVYGADSFRCTVDNPELAGSFYTPILGTLITGAARLMLALAESEVQRLGGTYAFMDTDSIAIVATKTGGLIPCPGGNEKATAGLPAIRALSWEQVEAIRERFARINPYDPAIVSGSILRREEENFAADGSGQQELWCYVVAAKRYALFNRDDDGEITIRKFSEHGLGHVLMPEDASGEPVRGWMDCAWKRILDAALGRPVAAAPPWVEQLVRTKIAISTPAILGWFRRFNAIDPRNPKGPQKPYAVSVKPFNFLEHAPLDPLRGRPPGLVQGAPFCLVTVDPSKGQKRWVNLYDPTGPTYRLVRSGTESMGQFDCIGRSFGDVIAEHGQQPEPKSLGPDGQKCDRSTYGVLCPRHVQVVGLVHIGKEANELELAEAGLITAEDEVLTVYQPGLWTVLQRILAEMPASEIQERTGLSRRFVFYLRAGKRRPIKKHLSTILSVAAQRARERLAEMGVLDVPRDNAEAVRIYADFRRKPETP